MLAREAAATRALSATRAAEDKTAMSDANRLRRAELRGISIGTECFLRR
jgi:hypothetical protein